MEETKNHNNKAIWSCTIGSVDRSKLADGSDLPLRLSVEKLYETLTGKDPDFCFSGWGHELSESELATVENRLPCPANELHEVIKALEYPKEDCLPHNRTRIHQIQEELKQIALMEKLAKNPNNK